jgi:hypothetical protein
MRNTSITGSASRRPITSRSLPPRRKLSVPGALRARVLGLVAPCFPQGIKDATKEHADCHDEAKPDRHFTTEDEITEEDLCSDEDEDDGERIFEITEAVDRRCKREVERSQT